MRIEEKIEALLNSGATQYAISKNTGISQSTISELKSGKRKIGNLTLTKAQLLADYYDTL